MVLAAVAVAGFALGFGKAGVAGTLGPFATALIALVLPADQALGLILPMLIFADIFAVSAYWRRWDGSLLPRLLVAALIGIVIGTITISSIDESMLRRLIGVAILLFALSFVLTRGLRIASTSRLPWGVAAGSVSGFVSTIAHAGGPPIVAYLMASGIQPIPLVGTTAAFFAAVNLIKVPGYMYAGLFDLDLLVSTAPGWVFVPVGIFLGKRLVERVDTSIFERVVLILLVAAALLLLLRG